MFSRCLLLLLGLGLGCTDSASTNAKVTPASSAAATIRQQLQTDVEFLAADELSGRKTGTPGNETARRYIVERLHSLGAKPVLGDRLEQEFELLGRNDQEPLQGFNVVAHFSNTKITTTDENPIVVLTAHYDHLGIRNGEIYNGADDNASGVSVLLSTAEWLSSEEGLSAGAVFVAFLDAEESGLQGATALVDALRSAATLDRVALNINLDMVGRSDGNALYVAGLAHSPRLRPLVEEASADSAIVVRTGHDTGSGSDNWTFASDHAAFHRAGVPFLYLGVEDHEDYHRPTDDSEHLDLDFLTEVAKLVRSLILGAS